MPSIEQEESETGFWFCSEPVDKNVQCPEPSFLSVVPRVQSPESSVQSPASSIHSPASNSCVQGPGIPVCHNIFIIFLTKIREIQRLIVSISCIECLGWCTQLLLGIVSYKNRYTGLLISHLLPLLNPWLIVEMQPP